MALRKLFQAALALALLLLWPLPLAGVAQEDARYGVSLTADAGGFPEEVRVFVSVTDPRGLAMKGLDAAAFTVEEDGVPVEDFQFDQQAEGAIRLIDVVLAVDVSGSMQDPANAPAIDAAREGLLGFLDTIKGLGRADVSVTLLFFGDGLREIPGNSWERLRNEAANVTATDSETHLYDAIHRSVEILEDGAGASRRVVVVLTDGRDQGVNEGDPGSDLSLEALVEELEGSAVQIFAVGVGEPDAGALSQIAEASGGSYRPIAETGSLPEAYQELAEGLPPVTYRIAYMPPGESSDGRTVKVTYTGDAGSGVGEATYFPPGTDRPENRIDWTLIALAVLGVLVVVLLVVVLSSRGDRRHGPSALAGPPTPWLGPAFVVAGYRYPISAAEMSIGRDPSTDICIAEPSVSRVHARVTMSPEGLLLEDLNSSNGTFVNGEPIRASYLQDGDSVSFGTVDVQFEVRAL